MLRLEKMGSDRLKSKQLEEVWLVGGPWCGMKYAILKTSSCSQIEVPGDQDLSLYQLYHLYQRDEEEGMLFYYVGDVEIDCPDR